MYFGNPSLQLRLYGETFQDDYTGYKKVSENYYSPLKNRISKIKKKPKLCKKESCNEKGNMLLGGVIGVVAGIIIGRFLLR